MNKLNQQYNLSIDHEIYHHLLECNTTFKPKLSTYVNIKEYSYKLATKSVLFKKYNQKNVLIGLIAVYDNKLAKEGYITNLSVKPNCSSKGIATDLLTECIKFFKSLDYRQIRLEVFNVNDRALNFYLKKGFVVSKKYENNSELILKL